jgi:acetylornithine deacetylase/succinyl-diaminopimelate desuccinylase-like protein
MEAQPILPDYRTFKAAIRPLPGYNVIAAAVTAFVDANAPKPTVEEAEAATRGSSAVLRTFMLYRATLRARVKAEAWFIVAAALSDEISGGDDATVALTTATQTMRLTAAAAAKDAATLALAADAMGLHFTAPINEEAF